KKHTPIFPNGEEEMKYLQEAFQKQLNEVAEKAEKQQATINFLKTEMERKSKMIRDLQNENKSLKNKLLSGNKLCGIHAEESKKIQAQLKEFRYGKKDLIFKAQQLTDLEQKLAIAKDKLEKAALDKESQLKALKETVQLCLSSVLHNQPPATNIIPSKPTEKLTSQVTNDSKVLFQVTNTKSLSCKTSKVELRRILNSLKDQDEFENNSKPISDVTNVTFRKLENSFLPVNKILSLLLNGTCFLGRWACEYNSGLH
uniref:Leucine zipper protein 2 n=1 Tax=Gopherus evgoodei TaxID=1825980 RepID=A0A8C4XW81_9SAUR